MMTNSVVNKTHILSFILCLPLLFSFIKDQDDYFVTQAHLPGLYKEVANIMVVGMNKMDQHLDPDYKIARLQLNADNTYEWKNTNHNPSFNMNGTWHLFSSEDLSVDGSMFKIKFSPDARTLTVKDPSIHQTRIYVRQ